MIFPILHFVSLNPRERMGDVDGKRKHMVTPYVLWRKKDYCSQIQVAGG